MQSQTKASDEDDDGDGELGEEDDRGPLFMVHGIP